jgi:hypothetical protein
MYWILDLLTNLYTPLGTISNYSATANLHNSQITTALAKHFPACYVLTRRSLATASNREDFSASRSQVLFSQPPVQNSCQFPQSQLKTVNSGILNPVLCCNYQLSRCHFFSVIFDRRFSTNSQLAWDPRYIASGQTQQKTPFPNNPPVVASVFVAAGSCLPSRCLAINVCSGSTIPAFRHHITVF